MWGWRTVGKYKDEDITIEDLILQATNSGVLLRDKRLYAEENKERILKAKTEDCESFFGADRPVYFINENKIDYQACLPKVIAWAFLTCGTVISDSSHFESYLILIWLQRGDDDPFSLLKDYLAQLDWAAHARDCSP